MASRAGVSVVRIIKTAPKPVPTATPHASRVIRANNLKKLTTSKVSHIIKPELVAIFFNGHYRELEMIQFSDDTIAWLQLPAREMNEAIKRNIG